MTNFAAKIATFCVLSLFAMPGLNAQADDYSEKLDDYELRMLEEDMLLVFAEELDDYELRMLEEEMLYLLAKDLEQFETSDIKGVTTLDLGNSRIKGVTTLDLGSSR